MAKILPEPDLPEKEGRWTCQYGVEIWRIPIF